jgi:hypothetical protein
VSVVVDKRVVVGGERQHVEVSFSLARSAPSRRGRPMIVGRCAADAGAGASISAAAIAAATAIADRL